MIVEKKLSPLSTTIIFFNLHPSHTFPSQLYHSIDERFHWLPHEIDLPAIVKKNVLNCVADDMIKMTFFFYDSPLTLLLLAAAAIPPMISQRTSSARMTEY